MTPKECLFCVCLQLGSNLLKLYCMVTVAVMLVQTSEDALERHCFFIVHAVIDIRLYCLVCVYVCMLLRIVPCKLFYRHAFVFL